MDFKKIIGIVIVAAIVVLGVIALVNFFRSRGVSPSGSTAVATASPMVLNTVRVQTGAEKKSYQIDGVVFSYPQSWGILTCSDSKNFEFDPTNVNTERIDCDTALKPITVLVNSGASCSGDVLVLGSTNVKKGKVQKANWLEYHYCFGAGADSFDISHRVSVTGGRAVSKDDYSGQIEQMITGISAVSSR